MGIAVILSWNSMGVSTFFLNNYRKRNCVTAKKTALTLYRKNWFVSTFSIALDFVEHVRDQHFEIYLRKIFIGFLLYLWFIYFNDLKTSFNILKCVNSVTRRVRCMSIEFLFVAFRMELKTRTRNHKSLAQKNHCSKCIENRSIKAFFFFEKSLSSDRYSPYLLRTRW